MLLTLCISILSEVIFSQDDCPYPTGQATLCSSFRPNTTYSYLGSVTSTSNLGVVGWSSTDVYISSTLTVNSNFTITNCNLIFSSSGKIIVSTNGVLTSTGSKYFSQNCTAAGWDGIKFESNGQGNFQTCHFEDAAFAIRIVSAQAKVSLYNNYFNRNDIGVYADNKPVNALIVKNEFTCTSNTYTGQRSSAGIKVVNGSISIGLPSVAFSGFVDFRNTFSNLRNGISATTSTINVQNCYFTCNVFHGIQTLFGTAYIGKPGSLYFPTTTIFEYNNQDIEAKGTVLEITNCNMSNCNTSNIVSEGNQYAEYINIHHNTISVDLLDSDLPTTKSKSAIFLVRSSGAQVLLLLQIKFKITKSPLLLMELE